MSRAPVSLHWVKSSFSGEGGNNCVEIAAADARIAIRESESPSEILKTSPEALHTLVCSLREGSLGFRPE